MHHFQFAPDDIIVDIRRDKVFKAVFTRDTPQSQAALRSLVSAYTGRNVEVLSVIANEPPAADLRDRQIRYDLRVKFDGGQLANVEVTLHPGSFETLRIEYYTARLYASQGYQKDYGDLVPVWQINFVSTRRLFPDESFFHEFAYYDEVRGISLGGRSRIMVVELEKIRRLVEKPAAEMSREERWAIFFRYAPEGKLRGLINEIMKEEEGTAMAGEMLLEVSQDEIELAQRETAFKIEMDWRSYMSEARKKGMAKARAEARREKLESARQMKADGFSPEQIQKYTGLSPEEVEAL